MGKSGFRLCVPVRGTGVGQNPQGVCDCNRQGEAVKIYKGCSRCEEWRCKSHCRCKRRGELKGRNCPRPGPWASGQAASKAAAAKATPKAAAAAKAVAKAASVLQPSEVKIYRNGAGPSWMTGLAVDLGKAERCIMTVFCYDDHELHSNLLQALANGISLRCVVDRAFLAQSHCYYMKPKLRALQAAGAEVTQCSGRGSGGAGNMHYKILVLFWSGGEEGACYHGSSNPTNHSRISWGCMTRFSNRAHVREFEKICNECWAASSPCQLD